MDFYFPTLLEPASSQLEILSSAGRFQSPLSGFTRTVSRPGERMRLTLSFQNTNSAMRAAVQYAIARMQGATHRIWAHDHSNRIRGSFPATELLTNNTFADGTTGWTANYGTLSVSDRVMRHTFSGVPGNPSFYQDPTLTKNVPYVARAMIGRIVSNAALTAGSFINNGAYDGTIASYVSQGLSSVAFVSTGTSGVQNGFYTLVSTGHATVGGYVEVPWCSLSRCALVDNGPNALIRSEEFDNAGGWNQFGLTVSANATVAPDGSSTADRLIESALNETHGVSALSVTVASAAADFALSVHIKPNGRDWLLLQMREGTGGTDANVWFNITTGAIGSTAVGANWSNLRTFISNCGNGWFRCYIVARKTNAATSVETIIRPATADGVSVYAGNGSSGSYIWGASLAQSSVPVRYVATTTAAVAATAQAASGPLHTKGWPASTNGLLLPGDQVQIGNQLHIVTASVNSDAAGLATLECYPARRSAPADNAPVIVNQPLGKFFLESDANGWSNKPGIFSDAEIVLAEAS